MMASKWHLISRYVRKAPNEGARLLLAQCSLRFPGAQHDAEAFDPAHDYPKTRVDPAMRREATPLNPPRDTRHPDKQASLFAQGAWAEPWPEEPTVVAEEQNPVCAAPALPKASDGELSLWISQVVHQDQQALARLYEDLVGRVYGLAFRMTRQAHVAEEVVVDTFWYVWRHAPQFDPQRGSPLAWIMTIARSRAIDALRKLDRAEVLADSESVLEAISVDDEDPQDLLMAVQEGGRLHEALLHIDSHPRQLLALAFFRGLSHEEIAEQTGLPLGSVKSSIRRALARLRQILSVGQHPLGRAAPPC